MLQTGCTFQVAECARKIVAFSIKNRCLLLCAVFFVDGDGQGCRVEAQCALSGSVLVVFGWGIMFL
jgi:hypothetical protein